MADANFTFVGTINMVKDGDKLKGYDQKTYDSGWTQRRANFNMVCGDNRHLLTATGGVMTKNGKVDPSAKIYTFSKSTKDEDGNEVKGEKMEIPFKDRTKTDILDKIAGFKLYSLDTEEYGRRDKLEKAVENYKSGEVDVALLDELGIKDEADAKAKLEESKAKRQIFASAWDFTKAINDHFKGGTDKNLYTVKGNVEIQYSIEKDTAYKSYVPLKIYRTKEGIEPSSIIDMEFFFGEGAVDDNVVSGYQRFYFSDKNRGIKGEFACETGFRIDNELTANAEAVLKKLKKQTFTEDRPYKKMVASLYAIDGAKREEIKYDDLTDDQKEDVDLGLITLEDLQKALGTAYGESVREYVLKEIKVTKQNPQTISDTDFTDMSKPHAEDVLGDLDEFEELL